MTEKILTKQLKQISTDGNLGNSDVLLPTQKAVKTYVGQKVKLIFDPPTNASLLQALKDSVAEFEWTLNCLSETPIEEKEET